MIAVRIALLTGLALLAFGPRADAQAPAGTAVEPFKVAAAAKKEKSSPASKKAAKAAKKEPTKKAAKASKKTDAKAKSAKAAAKTPLPPAKRGGSAEKSEAETTASVEVAQVKRAMAFARHGKSSDAAEVQRSITDPVARKLIDWAALRSDNSSANFSRYAAFINANPDWPAVGALQRRAEAMLWQERVDPAQVRAFFGRRKPLTAKGRFALARALVAQGDRAGAQNQVREAWHNNSFSGDLESQVMSTFGSMITADDHKARMDMRLYAEDVEAGLRSAQRVGGQAPAIAKARAAVIHKAGNAKSLLDGLPADAKKDLGAIFSRAQWLRRADHAEEAARVILSVPQDGWGAIDTDQWWIERRLVSRKLLDLGDAKTAYLVARDAVTPEKENYRVEHQFTAGWIALRFLHDPETAQTHFAQIAQGVSNPISLGRAHYWQGRALEAMGRRDEAHARYRTAAQYPTAYYGQIARAKLGLKDLSLHEPPSRGDAAQGEVPHAVELLYAIGERDMVAGLLADLGDRGEDPATLAALGNIATHHKDPRAVLLLGKSALGRGLPMAKYAFPVIGIPPYRAIGPEIEPSIVYSIARQESTFNPRIVSKAKAMGLMQVTPAAGRYVAKKFGVSFDGKRLLSDPVYNVQLGAAELGDLIRDYRGSYILAFAGYNAGRGRVRDWVARFGDPRDPQVDPIDWVERIPFSETRNYVQRVLENVQVYRVRFGKGAKLLIEADLRRGAVAN